MDMWDKGATPVDPEALRGKVCYAGLDLSTTTDLTALVLVFPDQDGGYDVLPFVWCPADGIRQRSQRDHAPYEHWARSGQVIVTDGSVVDYEAIRMELSALAVRYHIAEIAYDRWNATQLVTQLQQDGANVAPLGQGYQSLSAPSKEFEKLVRAGALRHGGHGPLRWCVANTVLETDSAKNIKPSKKKSTERIDLTVALIMAIERAMRGGNRPSVYEQRGVVAF
jgi:phage terminase large subunit-like protein